MSHSFGMVIESLVAVLLLLTIGYCMLLNKRLLRLKADEQSLKATIGELITATEIAERAIGGLKHTVRDVNENLGSQLNSATDMSRQLTKLLAEGDGVLRRISRIAVAARPAEPEAAETVGGEVDRRGGAGVLRPQEAERSRCMKALRDIRVIPVVLIAIFGLAVLKVAGLVIDGGYVFDYQPKSTKRSWAQESFNFPGGKVDPADITGSVAAKKEEAPPKPAVSAPETAKPPDGTVLYPDPAQPVSPSERALLERLQARRQELEARAREIDIRENLLKSAEKRIEGKVEELKAVESRIGVATEQKKEADDARLKGLVTMYEGMKPKDAAKVFDRLEMGVLFEIASKIAPRKMSDILGLMSPEAAERLTVEMARRAGGDKSAAATELPKIEGKMLPQNRN